MAAVPATSNKAKIARRVIEVLDYFDDDHREATVMDIVRRYGRPQSSTSELLSTLVELGLLTKDPVSRLYALAPRAALIGTGGQPPVVRDGRLVRLLDRLAAQTGLPVALFAKAGLKTQVVACRSGSNAITAGSLSLAAGLQEPLHESAAGWLLLSTMAESRLDSVLRRLNAEAVDAAKFSVSELGETIRECRVEGAVNGPAGFRTSTQVTVRLLPARFTGQPMAVGLLHGTSDLIDPAKLARCLEEAVRQCLDDEVAMGSIELLASAA